MSFQAHEGAQGQTDMIALGEGQPELGALDAGELLEAAMVDLDLPDLQRQPGALLDGHAQVAGGPVFNVAVWVNGLEHLDPAVAFEMHHCAVRRNEHFADGAIAAAIKVHQPIALELGQPVQGAVSQQLQVIQAAVPAIEAHQPRRKAARFGAADHRPEMLVLHASCKSVICMSVPVCQMTTYWKPLSESKRSN